jgi:hypothetical protein
MGILDSSDSKRQVVRSIHVVREIIKYSECKSWYDHCRKQVDGIQHNVGGRKWSQGRGSLGVYE